MTSFRTEPCNWPLAHCGEASTGEPVCSSLSGLSPEMQVIVQNAAISYLWNWTRRQFGTCPVTIRPCREECLGSWTTYRGRGWPTTNLPWFEGFPGPLNPALIGGQWFNLPCGGGCSGDKCSCNYVPTVDLLMGPVASIDSVVIGGEVLDPLSYRLDNYRYLVRTDGGDWPVCQDMVQDPTVIGSDTFQVTYQIGVAVPSGGQLAAGILACQMAKAACGDKNCQLPQRIQQITRQQVQTTVLDSYGSMYEYGTTGLWVVDSWVSSIMASNRQTGLRISSPDSRRTRRTTG